MYLEVEGQSLISPEGDGNTCFAFRITVFDIGAQARTTTPVRGRAARGGLMVYACTDIGTFAVKLVGDIMRPSLSSGG